MRRSQLCQVLTGVWLLAAGSASAQSMVSPHARSGAPGLALVDLVVIALTALVAVGILVGGIVRAGRRRDEDADAQPQVMGQLARDD